jgi:hypothetical protein
MSTEQDTSDALRKEAKLMLCSAIGLPEDIMSGAVDRAVDCIIGVAVLEATFLVKRAIARQILDTKTNGNQLIIEEAI